MFCLPYALTVKLPLSAFCMRLRDDDNRVTCEDTQNLLNIEFGDFAFEVGRYIGYRDHSGVALAFPRQSHRPRTDG